MGYESPSRCLMTSKVTGRLFVFLSRLRPFLPSAIVACYTLSQRKPLQGNPAMTFDEILAQVLELLQREGRVSYRALKLRFNLDDDYLEGLKDELIEAKRVV